MGTHGISNNESDADKAYDAAIRTALDAMWVRSAPETRLVGDGAQGTLFRRTRSRPVQKLAATPMQSYVWLLSQTPIPFNDLIETVRARVDGVTHRDVAWVVTDLIRDGYLQSGLGAHQFGPVQ